MEDEYNRMKKLQDELQVEKNNIQTRKEQERKAAR